MPLTQEEYRPRLMDRMVEEHLEVFGAVSLEGPKYCGKTWTALNHVESVFYLMDPARNYANRQAAIANPASVLLGDEPRLVDEWQEAPGIWDAIRFEVDQGKNKGRFLLTGSVTPKDVAPRHSGTGRISRLQMYPMTLFESGDSSGDISLGALLDGKEPASALYPFSFTEIANMAARGGWPESLSLPQRIALKLPEQYLNNIYASDVSNLDNTQRDPQKVKALMRALARNSATAVTNEALKWDISQGLGSISAPTVSAYLAALKRIFVLAELPGWAPDIRAKARMRTSPKRYLVDPSLTIAALGTTPEQLSGDPATLGVVFEGLCLRDLMAYSSCIGARLYHYRDNSGLEVDFILEHKNGSYAAIEAKLSPETDNSAAVTLTRFAQKMQQQGLPAPTARIVLCGGGLAHTRDDGIRVVPITSLRN